MIVVGIVSIMAANVSALAASPVTSAFVANLDSNIRFLDQSSRLAGDDAASRGIRDFARGETAAQVAKALDAAAPSTFVAADSVIVGRSVAIDVPGARDGSRLGQAANGRAPMTQADLDHLKTLSGRAFDDLYWTQELDALSQIEADYRAYIVQGDDPALIAMARRELPKVVRRLALLSKI